MSTFDSLESAYAKIIEQLGVSLQKAMLEGKRLAYEYIQNDWYNAHHHKVYDRLNLMTDSLRIDYEIKGNELIATMYIRDDLHPASNSPNINPISFEKLFNWFADGFGGEKDENEDIIQYTQEELIDSGKAFKIIQDSLKNAGFDIS